MNILSVTNQNRIPNPATEAPACLSHSHQPAVISVSVSLGAAGDSFYEYLFKSYLQSNKRDVEAKDLYFNAIKVSIRGWTDESICVLY